MKKQFRQGFRLMGGVLLLATVFWLAGCSAGAPGASAREKTSFQTLYDKIRKIEITEGEAPVFQIDGVAWLIGPEEAMEAEGWQEEDLADESGWARSLREEGMYVSRLFEGGEELPSLRISNGFENGKLILIVYDLYFDSKEDAVRLYDELTQEYRSRFEEKADLVGSDTEFTFLTSDPAYSQFRISQMGDSSALPYAPVMKEEGGRYVIRLHLAWAKLTGTNTWPFDQLYGE